MNEESLFAEALGKQGDDRDAFLNERCGDDGELRRRLEALLAAHERPDPFLEAPPPRPAPTIDAPPSDEGPGTLIGPYKILEKIGEGGFGDVYLADQTQPVRRKVALKILKAGMDSRQVVARFEAERQALAIMDHPNIARVLDAGTTPPNPPREGTPSPSPPLSGGEWGSARPYFVMELVKGIPITDFCERNRLTPRQRLELFIPVCQAVQHAHQKGVVHRDLKPSNVLVSRHDTTPVPKVIDFGIAKALGQELTDKTLFTGMAQMIGTPLYMSPEQAGMSDLDVDTRSDVYSLGVLLYELLTGTTPIDKERFKQATYDEIRRIIREEEPPTPSSRLSSTWSAKSAARSPESGSPGASRSALRAQRFYELDWIAMKALDKDRNRRYDSASALALDLQRYLTDEPVLASPPSTTYRLRKFFRKHRGPVTAASLLATLLVAGVIGTSTGLVRALRAEAQTRTERDKANGAALAEHEARVLSDQRLTQVQRANALLQGVFRSLNPQLEAAGGPTLREQMGALLADAGRQLNAAELGDPITMALLQNDLGESLRLLGHSRRALDLYQMALRNIEAAKGKDDVNALLLANNVGLAHVDLGEWDLAIPLFENAQQRLREAEGPASPSTLVVQSNLARAYVRTGQAAKAAPLIEEVLHHRRLTLPAIHPELLRAMSDAAEASAGLRDFSRAIALYQEVLEKQRARLGLDHFDTLGTATNLASTLREANRYDEAVSLYEDVLDKARAKWGTRNNFTLTCMNNLAAGYWSLWRLDRSIPLLEETLGFMREQLGPDHPTTLQALANLGSNYKDAGRFDEGIQAQEEALTRSRKLPPPLPETVPFFPLYLAMTYERAGKFDKAEPLYRDFLPYARQHLAATHPCSALALGGLGRCLFELKKPVAAEPLLREALQAQKLVRPEHWETFETMTFLGLTLAEQGRHADAESLLVQGCEGMHERRQGFRPIEAPRLSEATQRVVRFYETWGKLEQANAWRARLPAPKE